jgi:hypothetical protein
LFKKTPIFFKAFRIDVKLSQHKAKKKFALLLMHGLDLFSSNLANSIHQTATGSRDEPRTLEDKNSRDTVTLKGKLTQHAPSQLSSIYHRLSRGQEDKNLGLLPL